MSLLSRPSVVFAIVFGCFAVLIPRIFLPFFRTKSPTSSHNYDDHFRRPPHPMHRDDSADHIQHIAGSPPHMRGAHPSMRMHHPGASNRQQPTSDPGGSRSIITLALPMYTVGIGVFFIYTCCKYWSKRNSNNEKMTKSDHLLNFDKRKNKYDLLDRNSEEEDGETNKEQFYARLDPDYLEYLKAKKQKALEAEQAMTDEQKQMHFALEEMKKSLSYISAKLVTKESRGNLNGNEINQLQDRLASTEAQMCKILTALDAASAKVARTSKTKKKIQQIEEEEEEEEEESVSPSEDEEDEGVPVQDESTNSSNISDVESQTEEEEDQSLPMEKSKSD